MEEKVFWSYKIFLDGPKATYSNYEIAKMYGISIREAREYVEKDVEGGLMRRTGQTFFLLSDGLELLFPAIEEKFLWGLWGRG